MCATPEESARTRPKTSRGQLGPTYDIVHDHPINAGGPMTSWNIASHGEYWSDANVLDPLAQTLRDFMSFQGDDACLSKRGFSRPEQVG